MIRTAFPSLIPALALAACGGPAPVAAPPAEAQGASRAATATNDLPEITLVPDGIILVGAIEGRGTATVLAFGTARKTVLDVLAIDFPPPDLTRNEECGAGPMDFARFGGLTLNFQGDRLVGWFARPAANLVTADGIRPGDAMAQLRTGRTVTMAQGTLEGEFSYAAETGGTIGGAAGADGRVASLHAGVNCFFR